MPAGCLYITSEFIRFLDSPRFVLCWRAMGARSPRESPLSDEGRQQELKAGPP